MKVHFWGTRGSVPSCFSAQCYREKLFKVLEQAQGHNLAGSDAINRFIERLPFALKGTYGTCTPCVEIEVDPQTYLLCDAGSGLWAFGQKQKAQKVTQPITYHIFLSHLHWDHVQGFPMFAVGCKPQDHIIIHAHHDNTESFFKTQMSLPGFPVSLDALPCSLTFDIKKPDETFEEIAGFKISSLLQQHVGNSYAFRFEKEGKVVVYATDAEHHEGRLNSNNCPFIRFFKNADLLIFDAMATAAPKVTSYWGHSTHRAAVMLAAWAQVKRIALFHQNPALSDAALDQLLQDARAYNEEFFDKNKSKLKSKCASENIIMAYDSLELDV